MAKNVVGKVSVLRFVNQIVSMVHNKSDKKRD
jgi:hypothetical protein